MYGTKITDLANLLPYKPLKNVNDTEEAVGRIVSLLTVQKQSVGSVFSHSDMSDGSHPGTQASPLIKPPVFTGAHQVLASPVMGMLVEDPVAIHHIAGVDVVEMEAFIQGGAVISQLLPMASELWTLIDYQSVRALMLIKRLIYGFIGL